MYDYSSVVDALEIYITNAAGSFKLEDAFLALVSTVKTEEDESKKLSTDIEELLNNSTRLFKNFKDNSYMPRAEFFNGIKFCVTPNSYEIEKNILCPGHRFSAFCNEDIFPSEVKVTNGTKKLKTKINSCKMEKIVYSHFLLGSDQMMNFLIAENKGNYEIVKSGKFDENVKISAFDMQEIYEENSAKAGDALIFKVEDWDKGKFAFIEYIKASKRNNDSKKKWVSNFDTGMEIVFEEFGLYLEIPEQLAQAMFRGGKYIIENPDASFEEFYELSDNVEIGTVEGRSVLVPPGEALSEGSEIPDNVMISAGATNSINEILKESKCPLTMTEIESYIYDELHEGNDSYGEFYERCFGNIKMDFVDDGQKAIFENFIEDAWEQISERYERFGDEETGHARSRIIELVDIKRKWLETLKDIDFDLAKIPEDKMQQVVKISLQLNSFLQLLNSGEKFESKEDFENVMDAVEHMAELQENIIEEINDGFVNRK